MPITEALREYKRQWKDKHPGYSARMSRKWRAENPEKAKEHYLKNHAKFRDNHREKRRAQYKKWAFENPEKVKAGRDLRYAREVGAPGAYTALDWMALRVASGRLCFYCRIALDEKTAVRDHKTPLARGGSNDISNIAVSCSPCNFRKRAMTEVEFRSLLATDKV
jgi:5-methylcytosine-specific restriction endonuclease McrA